MTDHRCYQMTTRRPDGSTAEIVGFTADNDSVATARLNDTGLAGTLIDITGWPRVRTVTARGEVTS